MGRSKKTKPQYSRFEFKTGPLVKQFLNHLQFPPINFSSREITLLRPPEVLRPSKEQEKAPFAKATSHISHNNVTRKSRIFEETRTLTRKTSIICNPTQSSPRIVGCRCCQGCRILSRTYTRIPQSVLVPGDCKHKAGCRFARVLSDEGDDVQVMRADAGGVQNTRVPSLAQRIHCQLARAEIAGARGFQAAIIRDGRVEVVAQPPATQAAEEKEDRARQSLLAVQRQRDAALEEQDKAAKRRRRLMSQAEILDKNMRILRGQLKTQKRRYREQSAEWKAQLKLLKKRRKEMKKRGELDGEAVKAS